MSDDIYINIDDEQPKPVDVVQVEFDKQDVYIDVQQDYAPVLAVNGQVGYVTIKDNPSFGIYNYTLSGDDSRSYSKLKTRLAGLANTVSGIKNNDIVNFYFGSSNPNAKRPKLTLKVNPGILVDHNNLSGSVNLIKYPDNSIYSGKAIRKIRYNSTVGNGYEIFALTNQSLIGNPAIIRPRTNRLETFYDIYVPSGGGVRALKFKTPSSFPFVQGLCMNLCFHFQADPNPCIISGYSENNNSVFLINGANYNFIQKERVILISKGSNGASYEFKHW